MDRFFSPRSIAVIGASASPTSTGYALVANLQRTGFQGRVYPINPSSAEVLGIGTYPSIATVPVEIDLAVIALKSPIVPRVLQECGEAGVKAAIIVSDGFADGGDEGKELQRTVAQVSKNYGTRVIGPNTQGLINLDQNLFVFTGSSVSPEAMKKDGVSLVAQTGLFLGGWLVRGMSHEGLGLEKSVDLGNMCDVDHKDVLAYLGHDPTTQVIVVHMDRLERPTEFVEAVKPVVIHKPIIVVKPGKSPAGQEAVFSHTGSVAGDDSAFQALCQQTGLLGATDFDEVEDLVRSFLYLPPLTGKRIGVVDSTGVAAAIAADACAYSGLQVTQLSPANIDRLPAVVPSEAPESNSIDLVITSKVDARNRILAAVEALLADPKIDGIILATAIASKDDSDECFSTLSEIAEWRLKKPVSLWACGNADGVRKIYSLAKKGLVLYPSVTRAVKALAALNSRHRYLNSVGHSTVSQ